MPLLFCVQSFTRIQHEIWVLVIHWDTIFRTKICRHPVRSLILQADRASTLFHAAVALTMLITAPLQVSASESTHLDSIFQLRRLSAQYRLSFDSINMPDDQGPMGLFGLNYLVNVKPWLYSGVAGYGALSGNQGGLFTLGIEGGLHHRLFSKLCGDIGVFLGGGGGKVGTGDGLMVRQYVGLSYEFARFNLTLNYSSVSFPDSEIRGRQIGLSIDLPTDFYYSNPHNMGTQFENLVDMEYSGPGRIGFHQVYMALLEQTYFQKSGTRNTAGYIQDGTISLVGFELGRVMTEHGFISIKTSGAFRGIPHGYMDVMLNVGYASKFFIQSLVMTGAMGLGAGGGGHVETGSGFLVEPSLGVRYALGPSFAVQVNASYLDSPDGNLQAFGLTTKLIHLLDVAKVTQNPRIENNDRSYTFHTWAIHVTNQTYIEATRIDRSIKDDVSLVSVKADKLLNHYFYLTGQASSAYSGQNVGGFATGMIGLGVQSKALFDHHLKAKTELLLGAGGGGGLALGGGALVQPMVGLTFSFNPFIGMELSVGRVFALEHDLKSTVIDWGLVFTFSTLGLQR